MARDLAVLLPDRPGAGAQITGALAEAGIGVEGLCYFARGGEPWGVLHILVDDGDAGRRTIEAEGFEVRESRDVLIVEGLQDRPGSLAALLADFADRGVNIDLIYFGTRSRLVIGTEQMHDAIEGVKTVEAHYG